MMECQKQSIGEKLVPYIEGALADVDRREVHEHLQECGACSQEFRSLRDVVGSLRFNVGKTLHYVPPVSLSPDDVVDYALQAGRLSETTRRRIQLQLVENLDSQQEVEWLRELEQDLEREENIGVPAFPAALSRVLDETFGQQSRPVASVLKFDFLKRYQPRYLAAAGLAGLLFTGLAARSFVGHQNTQSTIAAAGDTAKVSPAPTGASPINSATPVAPSKDEVALLPEKVHPDDLPRLSRLLWDKKVAHSYRDGQIYVASEDVELAWGALRMNEDRSVAAAELKASKVGKAPVAVAQPGEAPSSVAPPSRETRGQDSSLMEQFNKITGSKSAAAPKENLDRGIKYDHNVTTDKVQSSPKSDVAKGKAEYAQSKEVNNYYVGNSKNSNAEQNGRSAGGGEVITGKPSHVETYSKKPAVDSSHKVSEPVRKVTSPAPSAPVSSKPPAGRIAQEAPKTGETVKAPKPAVTSTRQAERSNPPASVAVQAQSTKAATSAPKPDPVKVAVVPPKSAVVNPPAPAKPNVAPPAQHHNDGILTQNVQPAVERQPLPAASPVAVRDEELAKKANPVEAVRSEADSKTVDVKVKSAGADKHQADTARSRQIAVEVPKNIPVSNTGISRPGAPITRNEAMSDDRADAGAGMRRSGTDQDVERKDMPMTGGMRRVPSWSDRQANSAPPSGALRTEPTPPISRPAVPTFSNSDGPVETSKDKLRNEGRVGMVQPNASAGAILPSLRSVPPKDPADLALFKQAQKILSDMSLEAELKFERRDDGSLMITVKPQRALAQLEAEQLRKDLRKKLKLDDADSVVIRQP